MADETGAVTLDWLVLTGALVGTGMAVLGQLESGIQSANSRTADELRGYVIQSSFGAELCSGGISALQAREDSRVASAGGDRIDVQDWMRTYVHSGVDDQSILDEYARLRESVDTSGGWNRDRTIMTAMECEMVLRNLD
ncbi:MAG: hypothetical protein AAFY65_05390 [Pseudomonadota bacterium]